MAYAAVDEDGDEYLYAYCPYRGRDVWRADEGCVQIPRGSIEKLTGRILTWEDEPVELK